MRTSTTILFLFALVTSSSSALAQSRYSGPPIPANKLTDAGQNVLVKMGPSRTWTLRVQDNLAAGFLVEDHSLNDFFKIDTARYPDSLEELMQPSADSANWDGPYLKQQTVPLDPWGRQYLYALDRDGYTIKSFGADGMEGGDEEALDITNHDADYQQPR